MKIIKSTFLGQKQWVDKPIFQVVVDPPSLPLVGREGHTGAFFFLWRTLVGRESHIGVLFLALVGHLRFINIWPS